jgi:hypothetical protein
MENEKTIAVPSFDEAMKATGERVSPEEAPHLNELLRVSSEAHGQSFRRQKYRDLTEAESSVEHIRQVKATHEGLLAAAKQRLAGLPAGGWVVGAVFIVGFGACFGSEVVFNAAILPWILGVDARSVLGMALAIAPASAPVVLDRILARLLGVADPVDALAVTSGLAARVRSVARMMFLAVAGLATLYSIWVLADARAVASDILNDPNAVGLSMAQQHVVNLSLLLVSLVLTVNGALFYIFGVHEVKHAWSAAKVRAEVARLEGELRDINSGLSKAVPVLETARSTWEQIDELEKSVVDAFVAEGKFRIAQAMARPAPVQPAHARVREALDRRVAFRAVA